MTRVHDRRLLRPPLVNRRRDVAGLVSRLVPLAVLGIGMLVWANSVGQAQPPSGSSASFGQGGASYRQSPAPGNGMSGPGMSGPGMSGPGMSGPVIPSADEPVPQEAESSQAADVVDNAVWSLPGVVAKIVEGGWLMIPLGVCSLVVLALSLERMLALRRGRVIPRPFVRRFTECVEDGQLSYEEASEICAEFDCPVAEVFQAAVRRWGRPMLEIEQAVMDAGDRVADGLKRFIRVFHAISNVAPLLGLLGTVLGMIEAFETISSQESVGRPELLASGISTALITTAGGLLVAIPAYLAYMYFSSKTDRFLGEIDKLCQRVVDCISAEGLESASQGKPNRKRRAA